VRLWGCVQYITSSEQNHHLPVVAVRAHLSHTLRSGRCAHVYIDVQMPIIQHARKHCDTHMKYLFAADKSQMAWSQGLELAAIYCLLLTHPSTRKPYCRGCCRSG
jgi:hypothetical protein